MNILEINTCNYGSTGKIMLQIAQTAESRGHNVWVAYQNGRLNRAKEVKNSILIGNKLAFYLHTKLNTYTGFNGCGSFFATLKFLYQIRKLNLDLIQLHNLHNCYINLPLLFLYIKIKKIPVVWTLHDCWSFTGQCAHFDMINCTKWKKRCHNCEQINIYPSSKVDRTKTMWKLKKKWFGGIENLVVVTPSQWLSSLAAESYMGQYRIQTIHNGIDLEVFKKSSNNIKDKYGISPNKHIILGVSFGWGKRKGLDVFNIIAETLDEEEYQIVLVGTNDKTDKLLHPSIISIHKTNNQAELADIYSAADLLVNPTREEALGLVNLEANACGTPVVTFKTGGSPECICSQSGSVVEKNDINSMINEITRICKTNPYSEDACRRQAEKFDMNSKFNEYVDLYEKIILETKSKR